MSPDRSKLSSSTKFELLHLDFSKINKNSSIVKKLGLDNKSEAFFKASVHLQKINKAEKTNDRSLSNDVKKKEISKMIDYYFQD